ncbi:MAG TPA: hypothetical protein VK892_11105, partial [Pyrinomonadaceae bacterium]|nr:hypothetical protein [Pyrinomonadaceae bacterium]
HDLRASFATRMMFEKKLPSDAIRKVTGHKTANVFNRYLRPEAEDLIRMFRPESDETDSVAAAVRGATGG